MTKEEKRVLLKLLNNVGHDSVWGVACRAVKLSGVEEIVKSLRSQGNDNPAMMKNILGKELYNIIKQMQ